MPLQAGEHIRRYTSTHSLQISKDGSDLRLPVESSLPLATRAADGELDPVDLTLEDQGSYSAPRNPLVPVRISHDAGSGIEFTRTGIKVGLDAGDGDETDTIADRAFYANVLPDTDFLIAPEATGADLQFQLRSLSSPERLPLAFRLPRGSSLQLDAGTGAAAILQRGDPIATINPPSAFDANHDPVPASYALDGNRLITTVAHRSRDVLYPILVDPQVNTDFDCSNHPQINTDYDCWRDYGTGIGERGWTHWSPRTDGAFSQTLGVGWYGPGLYNLAYGGRSYNSDFAEYDLAPYRAGVYFPRVDYQTALTPGSVDGVNGFWGTCTELGMWGPSDWVGSSKLDRCNVAYDGTWDTRCATPGCDWAFGNTGGSAIFKLFMYGNAWRTSDAFNALKRTAIANFDRDGPSVTGLYTTDPNSGTTPRPWAEQDSVGILGAADDGQGVGLRLLQFTAPTQPSWTGPKPTAAENTSGPNEYNGTCDGTRFAQCPLKMGPSQHPGTGNSILSTTDAYLSTADGSIPIDVKATEEIGRDSPTKRLVTFRIDRSKPSVTGFGGDLSPSATWIKGGPYSLTFTASDLYAGVSQASVTLTNSIVGRDDFNRTTSNGWGTAVSGQPWTTDLSPDSAFATNGSQATVTPPNDSAWGRRLQGFTARDIDATVQVNFPSTIPPNGETLAYFSVRDQTPGANLSYKLRLVRDAAGRILLRAVNFSSTPLGPDVDTGLRYSAGTQYYFRAQVTGASPTTIKLKAWPGGQLEPSAWAYSQTDSTIGPQIAGSTLMGGKHTTGLPSLTIALDNFSVTDLGTHRYTVVDNHCTKAQGCPNSSPATFNWNTSSESEGPHTFTANAVDPLATDPGDSRHAITSSAWTVKLDRTLPNDVLSGDLYDARGQTLTDDHTYTLNMNATDQLSGVTSLTVDAKSDGGAPVRMFSDSQPGAADGSPMNRTWSVRPADYGPGHYTVTVTATDKATNARVTTFDLTVPSPPSSVAAPVVSGTPTDGETLSSTPGSWSGTGPIKYSYQWQHCDAQGNGCADLASEMEPTVTLRSADVGTRLRVKVTANNGGGSASSLSATSPVVAAVPPTNGLTPEVAGEPTPGMVVSALNGTWSGSAAITYQYQWLRCNPLIPGVAGCSQIPFVTAGDYTVTAADAGQLLRVRVTATNAAGAALSSAANSDPSDIVGSFHPDPTESVPSDPPPPTAAEQLSEAQRFRAEHGYNTDPSYIQSLDARSDLQDSRTRYGLSLDRYEQRDLELRNDIERELATIGTYGSTTASSSYAGYYIDTAHGSLIYVGFTTDPDSKLSALRGLFPYPAHLRVFSATYTKQQLVAVQSQVEDDADSGALTSAGVQWGGDAVDEEANRVEVEVLNPSAAVASTLAARYGNSVIMKTADTYTLTGPDRTHKQEPRGGLDIYRRDSITGDCTLGYIGETVSWSSGQRVQSFVTAGHCSKSYTQFPNDPPEPPPTMSPPEKENWRQGRRQIGETSPNITRNSARPCPRCTVSGKVKSDAVTIALFGNFDPKPWVYIDTRHTATVHEDQLSNDEDGKGYEVCASLGRGSNELRCGEVVRNNRRDPATNGFPAVRNVRLVNFKCAPGDSGSPVFHYIRRGTEQQVKAVGIVHARQDSTHRCIYSATNNVRDETTFRVNTDGG